MLKKCIGIAAAFSVAVASMGGSPLIKVSASRIENPLTVNNASFEEGTLTVPGWDFKSVTNTGGTWVQEPMNNTDLYANITSQTKTNATAGNNRALRFASTNALKETWLAAYSEPIEITQAAKGKDLNLQFDYITDTEKRVYYSLAFCHNGADGISGTADDYILKSGAYQAATGERTGGDWKKYMRNDSEAADGLVNSGGCYFGWDSADASASMKDFKTNQWASVNAPFKYAERKDPYGTELLGPDYVRVVVFTLKDAHRGKFNAIYDDFKVTYQDETNGTTELAVRNGDFEEDFEIPHWGKVTDKDGSPVDYEKNNMVSYSLSDSIDITNFANPGSFQPKDGRFFLRAYNNPTPRDKGDYFWSDPLAVEAGRDYKLMFDFFSTYRLSYGLRFFNEAGQVYNVKTKTFVDATKANLVDGSAEGQEYPGTQERNLYVFELGSAAMKNQWAEYEADFTAPQGAAEARVILFSPAGAVQTCMYDNVRVIESYEDLTGKNQINKGTITNGDVTIAPSAAAQGETVTLTAVPNPNHQLKTLTVTAEGGANVALNQTVSSDLLTYTFAMPDKAVTVAGSFERIDERPADEGAKKYLNVPNPGFERGELAKNKAFAGWNPIGPMNLTADTLYYAIEAGSGKDATRGLHFNDTINVNASGNGLQLISDPFPIPNENKGKKIDYTLAFDYKTSNYGGYFMNFYNESGQVWNGTGWKTITDAYSEYIAADSATYKSWAYITPNIQNTWESFSKTLVAPKDTAYVKVGFLSAPHYANNMFVDHVKVSFVEDKTPPAEVGSLEAVKKNGGALLTWTDPADKDLEEIIVEIWADDLIKTEKIAPKAQQYAANNLTNGTEYTFVVKTKDGCNNISTGSQIKVTPNIDAVNTPPAIISPVPDRTIWMDEKIYLDFNKIFKDEDNDTLTFRANKGDIASDNTYCFTPEKAGSLQLQITASDGKANTVMNVNVTVKAVPDETPAADATKAYLSVPNPGFERGTAVKNHEFPGWKPIGEMELSNAHFYELNATAGKGGSQALLLNDALNENKLGYGLQVISDPFPAMAENKDREIEYTLTFDYFTTRGAGYGFNFYNESGQIWNGKQFVTITTPISEYYSGLHSPNDPGNENKNKWSTFTAKATAPQGTVKVRIVFLYSQYWIGKVQYDNVKMSYSTNEIPVADTPISNKTIKLGETVSADLTGVFRDPDGDSSKMTYSVDKGTLNGMNFTFRPTSVGTHTVTVTATDAKGGKGTTSFQVVVNKNEGLLIADGSIPVFHPGAFQTVLPVVNAGFEAAGGWTGAVDKNGVPLSSNPETDCSFALGALTGAPEGTKALTLTKTNAEKELYVWSEAFDVVPGTQCDLHFQFKTKNNLGYAVRFFSADGKVYDKASQKFVDANKLNLVTGNNFQKFTDATILNKWVKKQEVITAPVGAVTARLMFCAPRNEIVECDIDDVRITTVSKEPLSAGKFVAYKGQTKLNSLSEANAGDIISFKGNWKNLSSDLLTATIAVVKYGENGAVQDIMTKVVAVPVTSNYEVALDYTLTDNKGSLAIFVWDSLSGMHACGRPTVIE